MTRLIVHSSLICCTFIMTIGILSKATDGFTIPHDDLQSDKNSLSKETAPISDASYDNIPMLVPKRAALLLDRLMVALHHALEDDEKGAKRINDVYGDNRYYTGKKIETYKEQSKIPGKFLTSSEIEDTSTDDLSELEARELTNKFGQQDVDTMGLQRRGHDEAGAGKGRVYWRCYFNAVTCF